MCRHCAAASARSSRCASVDDLREEAHRLLQIRSRGSHLLSERHGRQTVRQTTNGVSQGILCF